MCIVRVTDILPPLVEPRPLRDIYADGIADVDDLGDNFRTYFFTFSQIGDGPEERHIVARVIRPKRSILRANGEIAAMLAQKRHRFRTMLDG